MGTSAPKISRRKARELSLAACFEIELGGHDPETVLKRTIEVNEVTGISKEFIEESVRKTIQYRDKCDKIISELSVGWKIERIAKIDAVIMRMAIVELLIGLEENCPTDAVVINEAVVLAKKYSTGESGRFVNGILAKVERNKDKYREYLV